MRTLLVDCRTSSIRLPCFYYFFMVVVIRYETTATARWALLLIVRAFFNDTITVAVWTGFHVYAPWGCYRTPAIIFVGALRVGRLRNRLRQSLVANCSRSPKSFWLFKFYCLSPIGHVSGAGNGGVPVVGA